MDEVGVNATGSSDGDPAQLSVTSAEWLRVARRGVVHAERLTADVSWTRYTGEALQGRAGDWRIWSDDPDAFWTATDQDFRAGYRPADGPSNEYERIGTALARQAAVGERIVTQEGPSVAAEGDWLLHRAAGDQWFVDAATFAETYTVLGPVSGADAPD